MMALELACFVVNVVGDAICRVTGGAGVVRFGGVAG